jgi:hypothetical protein
MKKYYTSEINSYEIWNAEINDDISASQFSEILHRETTFVKEEDEEDMPKPIEIIFKNSENKYPFKAKTIFICKKMLNVNLLNEYKYENQNYNFDDITKRLQVKYYNEIFNGLELYIKLPGYLEFKQIENDNIDIIGFTDNKHRELKIDIIINPDFYYGYIFKIDNNTYKFGKNGNSVIREKIENSLLEPDFTFYQYNTNVLNKEEKTNSIVGKSEESYSGMFIIIGGTFINDQPVEWPICKRNLVGSKNYRAILQCQSNKSKHHLKLDGLKAQFNLGTMSNLYNCIKCLTYVYKNYCNKNMPTIPDEYVPVRNTATKSLKEMKIEGYLYFNELGVNFFKFGIGKTQGRVFDYVKKKNYSDLKIEFPDISFHQNPHCKYLSLNKIKNFTVLEQKIKCIINESVLCETYDNENGMDIREYFQCNKFDELFPEILKEIYNHNKN